MTESIMKSWSEFVVASTGLCKVWRFNKKWRFVSKILCFIGLHCWIFFEGRPVNCAVCGTKGHPLAYNKLNKILENEIEKLKDTQE